MTLTINKETIWKTSDGTTHSSHAMAEHFVLTFDLAETLKEQLDVDAIKAHDILNVLESHKRTIREWLDAGERMMQVSMGGPDT